MQFWDIRGLEIEPHHPKVLRSDDELRAIVIQLPGGDQLQEHQVHERAYVVVLDGEVAIERGGETVQSTAGSLLHFEPNERRTVTATRAMRGCS